MLPRGNDEIPGYQFIDEASQNKVLAICIQIPKKYATRQESSRQLSQKCHQSDCNKPDMSRGNQISARRKGNAVHRHVANNANPTGNQTK